MLNNTDIQPALTAEEWAEALTPQSEYEFYKTRGDVLLGWATSEAQELGRADPSYALGAYALFRSGRGFTRGDADNIEYVMREWGKRVPVIGDDILKLADLRQRILALLPPE